MLDKLQEVESRFRELTRLLMDPGVVTDRHAYREYTKEHANLEPVVKCYQEYQRVARELQESKELLEQEKDDELRSMAQAEIQKLSEEKERLHGELMILLLPKDPNDEKSIILEIRAGTGGDEAALFAGELFTAYTRYAATQGWKVEILNSSESSVGGFKEVIASVEGSGAYSKLKYERGVHRVQRVPKTEAQGRIHTSTVSVAVLPEAEEVDVQIQDKDLRIDVFRAGGHGGQSVNTTDSAVRITHLPTGLVVICQDEKSQHKNKAKAMLVLRSRLHAAEQEKLDNERRDDRRSQIGSGERAEKIRTYNFPQSRVSDHRIGLTVYQLDSVMDGKLDMLIEPLTTYYRAEALKASADNN